LGFLGFTAYNIALNAGQQEVQAGTASFIVASAPIWMAIFAALFLGERLKIWGYAGILLSFSGVTLISLSRGNGLSFNQFALFIVAAAMLQASYSISQKPLLKRYPPIALVSYAVWAGTLFLLIFLPDLWREIQTASLEATGAVLYMGIFPGAIAYVAWSVALSRLPASVAGSFLYLVPAFAVLIAWFWLGEIPAAMALAGGVLVALGVYVVNRYGKTA
jgi:drug/metabolite transporter (DMT)-like permease